MLALMKGLKEPEAEDSPEAEAQEEVAMPELPPLMEPDAVQMPDPVGPLKDKVAQRIPMMFMSPAEQLQVGQRAGTSSSARFTRRYISRAHSPRSAARPAATGRVRALLRDDPGSAYDDALAPNRAEPAQSGQPQRYE